MAASIIAMFASPKPKLQEVVTMFCYFYLYLPLRDMVANMRGIRAWKKE